MSMTMAYKNEKEEKRLMFFDMQEHPGKYTDEQVERLLADEEMKELLNDLASARMAGMKATPKKVDVDKAWKEFAETRSMEKTTGDKTTNSSNCIRMKIAASIVGIIFLSGVALAAVQAGWLKFSASDQVEDNKAATEQAARPNTLANDSLKAINAVPKDTLDMKPVVFDNAELGTILTQMADFYHVKVEYVNANAQRVRLFFNWNKAKTLEQNLKILNAFDRIQIDRVDGTLKVK